MELPEGMSPAAHAPQGPLQTAPQDEERQLKQELAQYICGTYGMRLPAAGAVVEAIDREVSKYEGISFGRILSMAHGESSFNPGARSRKGAIGLLQIMPGTGKVIAQALGEPWKGSKSLYDLETNIRYGVWYYNFLLERYGSEKVALAAYNWGPGELDTRLAKSRAIPVQYAQKILRAERRLKRELSDGVEEFVWGSRDQG